MYMMNKHTILSQNISLSALLATLVVSAFVVVIPSLISLQVIPEHYANTLPAGNMQMSDIDRDGIGDYIDARPFEGSNGLASLI